MVKLYFTINVGNIFHIRKKKSSEITVKCKYPHNNKKTTYLKTNITNTETASFFHKQWQKTAIQIGVTKPVHTVGKYKAYVSKREV
jgi:uncharacterized protein YifE (UPF0438 family)